MIQVIAATAATILAATAPATEPMDPTYELVGDYTDRLPECFYDRGGCGNRQFYVIPPERRSYNGPPEAPRYYAPKDQGRVYGREGPYRPEYEWGMRR